MEGFFTFLPSPTADGGIFQALAFPTPMKHGEVPSDPLYYRGIKKSLKSD